MQSLIIPLFSGGISREMHVPLPIVNQVDVKEKIYQLMNKKAGRSLFYEESIHVNCRELFQEQDSELFFFPITRKIVSLEILLSVGSLCLLKKGYDNWGFVLCFTPNETRKTLSYSKHALKFQQKNGYPKGVDVASLFYFSPDWVSVLVSQNGCIRMNDVGVYVLQGIEAVLLQLPSYQKKVLFLQKKNIVVSPINPLKKRDSDNVAQTDFKFIKIFCFCKNKNFCYSTKFPVLTEAELEKKLQENRTARLLKYGAASFRYNYSSVMQSLPASKPGKSHIIVFPVGMGINVPFGSCIGGEIFFVYGHSRGVFQLVFFPRLFGERERVSQSMHRQWDSCWHIKGSQPLVSFPNVRAANIYSIPFGKLVQCSALEFTLVGIKIKMVATIYTGSWGVFVSPEAATSLSVSTPNTQEEGRSSPVPGPSGFGSQGPTVSISQVKAIVSVWPERQEQRTQQKGSKDPVSGGSGRKFYAYGSSFPIFPRATVAFPTESESPQTQQEGRSSPLPGPSGIGCREATASLSQAEATVAFPTESETPQTQQEGKSSLLSEPYGIRQVIRPIPFRHQVASIASVSTERQSQQTSHTQQRRNSPIPGPSGVRYHPYSQYGLWSFSGGSHPYFYPGIGSFVGDFYPYGSPFPPCPYPFARQDQWMPVFPSFASVASLEPLRYNIPVQEGVGHSGRAEEASASVSVEVFQQTPIWRPYEESSSAEVSPKAQAENPNEDTDIDVEN